MIRVKASETAPRVAPNSACTTGSTTTTDHMPTLPIEPISTASASRTQAWREVGDEGGGIYGWIRRARARAQLRRPRLPGQATCDAILGMQMRCNRTPCPGRDAARQLVAKRCFAEPGRSPTVSVCPVWQRTTPRTSGALRMRPRERKTTGTPLTLS